MGKGGSRRERISSLNHRRLDQKWSDVTLSEFADSQAPLNNKGRLKKSKNLFSRVRQISSSEGIETFSNDNTKKSSSQERDIKFSAADNEQEMEENNSQYTEYPLKIWLLLAEYIRPEDVKSFSLICKSALSVVNTPLFWIGLYKRYYRRSDAPKCLSYKCLEIRKSLKQKVVRALYYFYTPFTSYEVNDVITFGSLVGSLCLQQRIQSVKEKDCNDGKRWFYSFKLCTRGLDGNMALRKANSTMLNNINYNPDYNCRVLKIACKEYTLVPSVLGMRLRKVDNNAKTTTLIFSSAPLSSKATTELGTVKINLEPIQKPLIVPWWHPDYWDHTKCCREKKNALSVPG